MDVGTPGSWDDAGASIFQVIFKNGQYRAWYTGSDGTHRRIGYATSHDGISWAKYPRPVLDLGADGTWDYREVATGHVLDTGSKYLMWYHGYDGTFLRIGFAESDDGIAWTKAQDVNPVLTVGPSLWDARSVGFPCVLRNEGGGFRMWYTGYSDAADVIGYAVGNNAVSWTKRSEPVLTTGSAGSWDDHVLLFPKVLFNGKVYEMWFAGSRGVFSTSQTGYATSPDGIHWTKYALNPVLKPGAPGSWDASAAFDREVLLDGNLYRMWYGGYNGVLDRTGYAVSPKGAEVNISANGRYVAPGRDTVLVSVRVDDPSGLVFSAQIKSPDEDGIDHLELFDDGAHGDGSAGDGVFANRWIPRDERHYSVDLRLNMGGKEPMTFELDNAGAFTTIGPVTVNDVKFVNDPTPNPGDTIVMKLVLRNEGSSEQADSVSATISTPEVWITDIAADTPGYGTIVAGGTAATAGYYRFFISPNCPFDKEIPLDIRISSRGVAHWKDRIILRVLPPWWRSKWAYSLYALAALGLFLGVRRVETRRLRLKHQREMERFQMEQMKQVDQLKSRFFAYISHEFRTPLTLIQGPIERMLSEETQEDAKDQYRMILRNSRRLLALVNQLLDLSKIESGQMKLHVREMDIVEVIRGISASFELLALQKGIGFSIDMPHKPVEGWFDRDCVEKIVSNLLSNAFKYTPEGGQVKVHVSTDAFSSDNVHVKASLIRVSDTGIGIPPGHLDKIFGRFYQVDASHTLEQEGSGLGLALTKELVDLHKGEITVASEQGKGSTFTVRLPFGKEQFKPEEIRELSLPAAKAVTPLIEPLAPAHRSSFEPEADETSPLLLIVEDNADMRKYIGKCLDNYRLVEAVNGEEGVERAIKTIPDFIISDVMMPKMDGFALCAKLKTDERTSHIPIILLTAKAGVDQKIEGLETGADDYVTKPFEARELQVRVRNLIDQRRKLRERFGKEGGIRLKEITVSSTDERFMKRALEVAESHVSDPTFTAEQFAGEMFLSRMQLHRKMRALTGLSPWLFVRKVRLQRAADLLRKRAGNVADIAYQIGYESPSRFAEAFRREFGETPSEFQTTHKPE